MHRKFGEVWTRLADLLGRNRSVCSERSNRLPGSIHQTLYCRQPGISCRRPIYLEQSAGHCDFSSYSVYVLPATESLPVRSLLP